MALQLSMKTNEAVREIWGDIGEIQGRYRALQLSMRTNEAVREMALDISLTSRPDLPNISPRPPLELPYISPTSALDLP